MLSRLTGEATHGVVGVSCLVGPYQEEEVSFQVEVPAAITIKIQEEEALSSLVVACLWGA